MRQKGWVNLPMNRLHQGPTVPINQLPLGAWAGLLQELNEGRGGLVGPIARQNSLLRRQQWLVKLPITGLPCGLTQQTMVAMALQRQIGRAHV